MYNIYQSINRRIKEDEIYNLLNAGNNKKALQVVNWCHENDCITDYILALESAVLARIGKSEKSLKLAEKLTNVASTDYNVFYCLVDAFRVLGRYSQLEQLCLNAIDNTNDKSEFLKILMNTYVRMMDFDLAQKTSLKLFVKSKNMSVGVLYCLFSILKRESNATSIQIALKFLDKIDFSQFKPEIYYYLFMSLLLANKDYDGIIEYFSKNNVDLSNNDNLQLLLHVYIKKNDYKSALKLLYSPNNSLNLEMCKIDLSILTDTPYCSPSDIWLELEYIKKTLIYDFYLKNRGLPRRANDLWENKLSQLENYLKLLKTALIKFVDKSFFLKFASQFVPIVNACELFLENADDSLNSKINAEKLKIASGYYYDLDTCVIDDRIDYFLNEVKTELNDNVIFLLIELYLIKYNKLDTDYRVIVELLSAIEDMCRTLESNILYNVLISLYGHIGCIEKAHHYGCLIGLKGSQFTTQVPRLLHFASIAQCDPFVKLYVNNFMEWYTNTRGSISTALVSTVEKCPHMVPNLCYTYNTHIKSGLYLYNILIDVFSNIGDGIEAVLKSYDSYIDLNDLLLSDSINWYYRNVTTGFDGFIVPTFHYSCLLSLPLITLQEIYSPDCSVPLGLFNSVSHFDEHELVFPKNFYRSVSDSNIYEELLFKNPLISELKDFRLYTDSALYKFNIDIYQSIQFETQILSLLLLIITKTARDIKLDNEITELKSVIKTYISLNLTDYIKLLSNISESLLNHIDEILRMESGSSRAPFALQGIPLMDCIEAIEKSVDDLNANALVRIYKFTSFLYLMPLKLVTIMHWVAERRNLSIDIKLFDDWIRVLADKIVYLTEKLDLDMEIFRNLDESVSYELYKSIRMNLLNFGNIYKFAGAK